jgi:hypothetical protein
MKKIFWLILIFTLSIKSGFTQQSVDISAKLKEVNNDTLRYIKESIIAKNENYAGQSLDFLLKDLPKAVAHYINSPSFRPANVLNGTALCLYGYNEIFKKVEKKINPMVIVITWEKQLTFEELQKEGLSIAGGSWNDKDYLFFKNRIIKKVEIVQYDF